MNHPLTHREMEIAELISFGLTEKEMANYLNISQGTIHSHKNNLFYKTGCRNIADVTRWYIQHVSGIKLEPREPIKKLVSVFMLVLIMLAEFADTEFIRVRTRARATTNRVMRMKRGRRRTEDYQYQIA